MESFTLPIKDSGLGHRSSTVIGEGSSRMSQLSVPPALALSPIPSLKKSETIISGPSPTEIKEMMGCKELEPSSTSKVEPVIKTSSEVRRTVQGNEAEARESKSDTTKDEAGKEILQTDASPLIQGQDRDIQVEGVAENRLNHNSEASVASLKPPRLP
ncbi:hypothetical protein GH714_015871 [Hevea brasiliensis]|uniref:Uncharacterized protein n=1 Tax=Hevea brasiliensis TaxID=3981 RepID=A0A6A6LII0_HEVBR|nr:hypothetical protein GH714_015871 [Hevea brasiliensis]